MHKATLEIEIEETLVGPLSNERMRRVLKEAVATCSSLDEAARVIPLIPGLAAYKGGSHVAVHPTYKGKFADGSSRLAIITENEGG